MACVLQGVERFTLDFDDPRRHVDMFLRDDLSYEVLNVNSDVVDLDGRPIKIASVEKMLEIKEAIDPPRDKDILDIAALKRLLSDG